MKPYLLRFAFLFIGMSFHAQHQFNDQGFEVTKADLQTNTFANDTIANAIVIYETGNSSVDKRDYRLKTEVKRKIKIFNKDGFRYGAEEIVLYNNDKGRKESIDKITATIYNLNGEKVETAKLDKSQIFEIPEGDNHTRVKFAFPNVKEGSVIVYSYTKESPFMFNYHGWNFQGAIPKLYSEYKASIPGNWTYNIKLVGTQKLAVNTSDIKKNCLSGPNGAYAACAEYHYVMKDIPAFVDEDYMTTRSNYMSRIEYELTTFQNFDGRKDDITKTWRDTDSELEKDKNIGRQLAKSNLTKDLLDAEILAEPNSLERAKKVYQFVQRNYVWNDEYSIFHGVSLKDLINEKSGSVSEINILLHNLLEQADIKVKPVLMSTRGNGFITKLFPVLSEFNYMAVKAEIEGTVYMLDATDKFLPFGVLPFRCLNQYARVLDFDAASEWIDIKPFDNNMLNYRSQLELTDDMELTGYVDVHSSGYKAIENTKAFVRKRENYLEDFETKYPDVDFISHEITEDIENTETYQERFEISYPAQATGQNIYIKPFVFEFFESNPFKLQTRTYPIDFGYSDSYSYTIQIRIPENCEVVETPESKLMGLPNKKGLLTLNTSVQDRAIMMIFKFSFKEPIYEPEFYDALKLFMSEIIDIEKNSMIVLKRSS